MTDPLYGDSPVKLNLDLRWYTVSRPPLVPDPEYDLWRVVLTTAVGGLGDAAESAWLVRWRTKSVTTAFGVHLDALAAELGFLRPDGWTDDRFKDAAVAIDGAVLTNRPPSVTQALAAALVQPGQSFEFGQADALTYVVIFYGATDDEAQTYCSVMEYGRPKGVRKVCAWSSVSKAATFVLDVSELDGPDILAQAFA